MRRATPTRKPYDYGFAAGRKDRHGLSNREQQACFAEPHGFKKWLAGWRAGQKARRRADPPEEMRYHPLYPQRVLRGTLEHDKWAKRKRRNVPASSSRRRPDRK